MTKDGAVVSDDEYIETAEGKFIWDGKQWRQLRDWRDDTAPRRSFPTAH
jgi:hypothetical protein